MAFADEIAFAVADIVAEGPVEILRGNSIYSGREVQSTPTAEEMLDAGYSPDDERSFILPLNQVFAIRDTLSIGGTDYRITKLKRKESAFLSITVRKVQ